jgi:hypothetical protein
MATSYRTASDFKQVANTETAITLDRPSGTADGDLLLAFMMHDDESDGPYGTAPTSWTKEFDEASPTGDWRMLVYSKDAGASEPSTYTWSGLNNGEGQVGCIVRVDGQAAVTPLTFGSTTETNMSSSYTCAAASVTVAADGALLIGFWAMDSDDTSLDLDTGTPPSGMTLIEQSNTGQSGDSGGALYRESVNSGATGTRTATWTAYNTGYMRGLLVVVEPAASGVAVTPPTGTVSITGQAPSIGMPPKAPTDLTATPSGDTVALSWTDNESGAHQFRIYGKRTTDPQYKWLADTAEGATSYTDTWLVTETAYSYRVTCWDGSYESAFDSAATTTEIVRLVSGSFL